MRGAEIKAAAESFGVPIQDAIRTRIAYLMTLIDRWNEYIDNPAATMPESTIMDAMGEISKLREYAKRIKRGPIKGEITDEMIQAARDYPIAELFDFSKSGRIPCPFHNSKGPDLSYHAKTNTVRCFGACGKRWDSIGVLMERDSWHFVDAVKYLSGNG